MMESEMSETAVSEDRNMAGELAEAAIVFLNQRRAQSSPFRGR